MKQTLCLTHVYIFDIHGRTGREPEQTVSFEL